MRRSVFQYAWDLARGTEHSTALSPEVAGELLALSKTRVVPQRGPGGFFGPEFTPPEGGRDLGLFLRLRAGHDMT